MSGSFALGPDHPAHVEAETRLDAVMRRACDAGLAIPHVDVVGVCCHGLGFFANALRDLDPAATRVLLEMLAETVTGPDCYDAPERWRDAVLALERAHELYRARAEGSS
jgi:hypothetical protein